VYAVEATGITTTHNLVNKWTKEKGTHHASPLFVHIWTCTSQKHRITGVP
jgi:hypothetical protein